MKKSEEKIYKKYLKRINKLVKSRYKKISKSEALSKSIYLNKNDDLNKIKNDIYKNHICRL